MTRKRFFLHPESLTGDYAEITGAEAHHLRTVLRLGPGARVYLLGTDGTEYEAEIVSTEGAAVSCHILRQRQGEGEPDLGVTLVQGLTKGDKIDLIVQKATEIGVSRLVVVATARSVVSLSGAKAESRIARWQRIAQAAAKQCGRSKALQVEGITTLAAWLAAEAIPQDALFLLPWENAAPEADLAAQLQKAKKQGVRQVYYLIGPEGGLTLAEAELAQKHGAIAVSLGPRILRTETAAMVTAALIFYELGDLGRNFGKTSE